MGVTHHVAVGCKIPHLKGCFASNQTPKLSHHPGLMVMFSLNRCPAKVYLW